MIALPPQSDNFRLVLREMVGELVRNRVFDPLLSSEDFTLFDDRSTLSPTQLYLSGSAPLADIDPPSDGVATEITDPAEPVSDGEPALGGADGGDPPALDPMPIESIPSAAPVLDDPQSISASRILEDRPDVYRAFYESYYGPGNDHHSTAWAKRVGGSTPEAYAKYWYDEHGKYEGYSQGLTTAGDNVSLEKILHDRPDVLRGFYEGFYGPNNDRNSDAWAKRVGGDTPEAYAKYWYEKYGKWEGYAQTEKTASQHIDVEQLLQERPDVFRAFYTEYYGPHNDRHSSAWVDRVGGDTVQDYAKYWYETYGKSQGYNQRPQVESAPTEPTRPSDSAPSEAPRVEDPSLDPWNHPAIYPDHQQPTESDRDAPPMIAAAPDEDIIMVGRSLGDIGLFE